MAIITLTTDFGLKDYYVSAVKGSILSLSPQSQIVDITHLLDANDTLAAAYIVKNAYKNFPKGSIHIIGVDSNSNAEMPYTVAFTNGHYFIATDNGIFSLLFDSIPEKMVALDSGGRQFTFPTRDVFAKAACFLANGGSIDDMGIAKTTILQRGLLNAASMGDLIKGIVVHIDNYGNAITNISKTLFDQNIKNRRIEMSFGKYRIQKLSASYFDVVEGEVVAFFNAENFLELAIRNGSASELNGIKINDSVTINFL